MACFKYSLLCYSFLLGISISVGKPNIVVIIADDLGWNDVGFHGSNEIPTPNIDALAYNGIILNRHYVLPTCTPSRAALMTGKYPIRTGLQGDPGKAQQPWALPLNEKILPQYLKNYGYKTHLVGKWHLGFYRTAYTPTQRGFDTHFGYYNGWTRYNDSVTTSYPFHGIDAHRNLKPAGDEFVGQYATDVFTKEAVNIIRNHDSKIPLFLELSHVAPHAVKNNILQVRDENENDARFKYIVNGERRRLAGVLQALDESVGKIIEVLKETNLLENSVVLFISDNGGPTEDREWDFRNSASNWPLRGMKTSVHEGGVRGAAAIWSPLFARKNYVSDELFHITDWLPTFVSAAGGDPKLLENTDGVNQWNVLIGNQSRTDRREVLVNVDHERNTSAIIQGNWKLIKNNQTYQPSYNDYYAGVTGRAETPSYDLKLVLNSTTNHLIGRREKSAEIEFLTIRSQAILDSKCRSRISSTPNFDDIRCLDFCLFDLEIDPCESSNVAKLYSDIVNKLNTRLQFYENITVQPLRFVDDANANPDRWGGYWSPWTDESNFSGSSTIVHDLVIFGIAFVVLKKIMSRV